MAEGQKTRLAEGLLLLVAVAWGSGFVVMKDALNSVPVHFLLGVRFCVAAMLFAPWVARRLARQTRADLRRGIALGVVMYAAYAVQTYGLMHTTAGRNAFLTAVYVVAVPLLACGMKKVRPTRLQMGAAGLCLLGIGVLALNDGFDVGVGDALSLLSGILFAVHIVMVSYFTKKSDTISLTVMQFAVCGALGMLFFGLFETPPARFGAGALGAIAYLAIVCTLLALLCQNIAIRYADASHASLIMGMEALFGALAGVVFLSEPVTLRMLIGGAIILSAIVLSEVRVSNRAQKGAATGENSIESSACGYNRLSMGDAAPCGEDWREPDKSFDGAGDCLEPGDS